MKPNAETVSGEKVCIINETRDGIQIGYIFRGKNKIQTQWDRKRHFAGSSKLDLK